MLAREVNDHFMYAVNDTRLTRRPSSWLTRSRLSSAGRPKMTHTIPLAPTEAYE
jgi:hypothetical protein